MGVADLLIIGKDGCCWAEEKELLASRAAVVEEEEVHLSLGIQIGSEISSEAGRLFLSESTPF